VVRQRGVTRCHFSLPRCPALDSSGAGFRVFCPASPRSGPPGARGWQQFGRARSRRGGPSRRAALPAYATTTNYYYYYYIAVGGIYRNCVAAGQAGHPHERAPDHRRPGAQASGDGGGATRRRPRRSGWGQGGTVGRLRGTLRGWRGGSRPVQEARSPVEGFTARPSTPAGETGHLSAGVGGA
jgi:hypothetical protein